MIEQKLKIILSNILMIEISEINEDTSMKSVEKWDSINHINIILSIEEEFKIRFSEKLIEFSTNFSSLKKNVKKLLKDNK